MRSLEGRGRGGEKSKKKGNTVFLLLSLLLCRGILEVAV
jgi:hypothetical protein